ASAIWSSMTRMRRSLLSTTVTLTSSTLEVRSWIWVATTVDVATPSAFAVVVATGLGISRFGSSRPDCADGPTDDDDAEADVPRPASPETPDPVPATGFGGSTFFVSD